MTRVLFLFLFSVGCTPDSAAPPPGDDPFAARPVVGPPESPELDPDLYVLPDDTEVDDITVKFNEGTAVRVAEDGSIEIGDRSEGELEALEALGIDPVTVEGDVAHFEALLAASPMVERLRPRFSVSPDVLADLRQQAEMQGSGPLNDLTLYASIVVEPGTPAGDLQELLLHVNGLDSVGVAYATSPVFPTMTPATLDYTDDQDYFGPSPAGLDVDYARLWNGGAGAGLRIIDVENGWNVDHEDLPSLVVSLGSINTDRLFFEHGTAVLGILGAEDNGFGVTGIAHDAELGYVSLESYSIADAIAEAAAETDPGDVILMELQIMGPTSSPCTCVLDQCNLVAGTYDVAVYDAVKLATGAGRFVVEAAGNGSTDLDDPAFSGMFNRSLRDSGSIMVGASEGPDRSPTCFTNYGSRVDVHGWGEQVTTTGYGDLFNPTADNDRAYTSGFSGTSSASALVAGTTALLQSITVAYSGFLIPVDLRDIFVRTGTLQSASPKHIGPMPDLRDALGDWFRLPRLYGISQTTDEVSVVNPFAGTAEPALAEVWYGDIQTTQPIEFPEPGVTTIAYHEGNDSLYVVTGDGDDRLYRIRLERTSGVAAYSVVTDLGLASNIQGMDFAPVVAANHGFQPGLLYAVSIDGVGTCSPNCLFSIDLSTGDVDALGAVALNQGRGVSFDPITGELWVLDAGGKHLYTMLPDGTTTYRSTVASSQVDTRDGLDTGFSLAHGHDGEMYIVDIAYGVLLQVDPSTGEAWWEGRPSGLRMSGIDGIW